MLFGKQLNINLNNNMLTLRNLQKLKAWGEEISYKEDREWTKWDQNLLIKILHEIEDFNHNQYKKRKK